jgi:hypothetical protein
LQRKLEFGECFHRHQWKFDERKVWSSSFVLSLILVSWLKEYGKYVDIIAISIDSFDEDINKKTGRGTGQHVASTIKASELCKKYGTLCKTGHSKSPRHQVEVEYRCEPTQLR